MGIAVMSIFAPQPGIFSKQVVMPFSGRLPADLFAGEKLCYYLFSGNRLGKEINQLQSGVFRQFNIVGKIFEIIVLERRLRIYHFQAIIIKQVEYNIFLKPRAELTRQPDNHTFRELAAAEIFKPQPVSSISVIFDVMIIKILVQSIMRSINIYGRNQDKLIGRHLF